MAGLGNNNKLAPTLIGTKTVQSQFGVYGKSLPLDSIELFVTDLTTEVVYSFVTRVQTLSDSTFFAPLPNNLLNIKDFYISATATDTANNTSELSAAIRVVYCPGCKCVL